jgi:hypothetical protein
MIGFFFEIKRMIELILAGRLAEHPASNAATNRTEMCSLVNSAAASPPYAEDPMPDLTTEDSGIKQVIRGLVVLIEECARSYVLDTVALPPLRRPKTSMKCQPEEEFHLWRNCGSPVFFGPRIDDIPLKKE